MAQQLFMVDEQLMGGSTPSPYPSVLTPNEQTYFATWNNQARMSQYYQDNPWDVISFSTKFGLPAPGGPIDGSRGSGSRPFVPYTPSTPAPGPSQQLLQQQFRAIPSGMIKGIVVPSSMTGRR